MESAVSSKMKKVVGISALGAVTLVDLLNLQQASATTYNYSGPNVNNPKGGSVTIAITVDDSSGTYRIAGISAPVSPGGGNSAYFNLANPTLTSEAVSAQSANISAVSGATEISSAWKQSLSGAISAAAAAGHPIGSASVAPVPTVPTGTTPAPGASGVVQPTPGPVTSPGGITVPYFAPLNLPPLIFGTIPGFAAYLAQISNAQSSLNSVSGGQLSDSAKNALSRASNTLNQLRSQVQSEQSQYASAAGTVPSAAAYLNQQFANLASSANQAIAEYYSKVQTAANTLYTNAVASAAAIPTPTVTVTVMLTVTASQPINFAPGVVIKKTFTCVKTVLGVTTTKVVKAVVVKCPLGFKVKK